MAKNDKILEHQNVNGVMLSLKVDGRNSSPKSRQFTISYATNKEKKATWPMTSLCIAILVNILALSYVRISLTILAVIIIVLSFLIFFWVTHSVQSEILLVIPTVGIQSSVKYVVGREDYFVPWSSIDDVIINEVIKMYTKPRLVMLESIYSELQELLTEQIDGAGDTGDN
ncbi:hypothetical protein MSG28_006985 [Choristoneura fumiferana]|uniref:Uncharacterized protein n=1 Tax=Choristoneura fumiferana TaxID=7141 RepID=A0ACC0JLX4_CHOFU|nr:hypothetical protein MSG28_006985 [Choristoneura fumiferana]